MRNRIIALIEAEAKTDPRVVFLTGDLGFSVVEPLAAVLGERFINMGVAEANMISVASSLAAQGFRPLAYSIAPFISLRCLEQVRNDVAYQGRAVRLVGVGAGFSYGTLGPSHHGLDDATMMAAVPDMIVCNPGTIAELDRCYAAVAADPRPAYFRIAREPGGAQGCPIMPLDASAYIAREGHDATIVTSGSSLKQSLEAAALLDARGIGARVISVPVLSPFPQAKLAALLRDDPIVCVMEASRGNPLAFGTMRTLLAADKRGTFVDRHVERPYPQRVGSTETLRADAGLDAASIAAEIQALVVGAGRRRAGSASA